MYNQYHSGVFDVYNDETGLVRGVSNMRFHMMLNIILPHEKTSLQ
jgi:hypothetical protein